MIAATMNEMERLRKVNAEWEQVFQPLFDYVDKNGLAELGRSRVKSLINAHEHTAAQLNAALEREQALAAHAERMRNLVLDAWKEGFDAENSNDIDYSHAVTVANSEECEHTESLARRDLIKQAEALEEIERRNKGWEICTDLLGYEAQELRQRAQNL